MARRRRRSVTVSRAPAAIVRYSQPRAAAPIVIRTGGGGLARRARAGLRRGVSKAATYAREESHTLVAVGAAAALGYAEAKGVDLPHVEAIGLPATYGLVALLIGRYTNSRHARHVATGLLSCAARDLAKEWAT